MSTEVEEYVEYVRNPISMVHEYCQVHQTSVAFKVVREEGEPHLKLFTVSCTVFDMVTTGTGGSIKQAKLDSATRMISELKTERLLDTGDLQINKKKSPDILSDRCTELKLRENPIGCLQEYCMAMKLPLPDYTNFVVMSGFSTVCRINNFSCQGHGRQKKAAKANAARQMFELLMNKLHYKSEISYYRRDEADALGNDYEEAEKQITVKVQNKNADETEELKNEFEKLLIKVDDNLINVMRGDENKKENENKKEDEKQ